MSKLAGKRLDEAQGLLNQVKALLRKVNVGSNENRALRDALTTVEEAQRLINSTPTRLWD